MVHHPPGATEPHYIGVRCPCGAYLVFEEVRGDPARARSDRLDRPAWVICDACGTERQYFKRDLILFTWPPPPPFL